MLSYQHAYHAGNLADVHKHCVQLAVLRAIVKSGQGVHYLESHAGRGRYDLQSPEALKTGESQVGIERLVATQGLEGPVNHYKKMVLEFSQSAQPGALRYYPGSPAIARRVLRRTDRATLYDLHPQEFGALKSGLAADKRFQTVQADGLQGVLSRSGDGTLANVALVDPSYEQQDEFPQLAQWLDQANTAQNLDVLLLWYPRLTDGRHDVLEAALQAAGDLSLFDFGPSDPATPAGKKMYGSGMGLVLGPRVLANKDISKTLRRHMKVITKGLSQWFNA